MGRGARRREGAEPLRFPAGAVSRRCARNSRSSCAAISALAREPRRRPAAALGGCGLRVPDADPRAHRGAIFVVIDCLRLDQWMVLQPILAPLFDVETTHYFSVLPTATPYSRNSLFSGLFPGEIAARFPDWWGEREDESLNAHEKQLLEAQLAELQHRGAGALRQDLLRGGLRRAGAPRLGRDRARRSERVRLQLRGPAHPRAQRIHDPL